MDSKKEAKKILKICVTKCILCYKNDMFNDIDNIIEQTLENLEKEGLFTVKGDDCTRMSNKMNLRDEKNDNN